MQPMFHKILTHTSRSGVAAMLATLFLVPASVEATIVANGSFEQNQTSTPPFPMAPMTSWIVGEMLGTPPTPDQNRVVGMDTQFQYGLAPRTGNIAAAFNSNTNTVTTEGFATLTQVLTTDTTKTYDVSLWLANPIDDNSNFNNVFSVEWNGSLVTLDVPSKMDEVFGTKTYIINPNTPWFQVFIPNLAVTGTSTSLVISARNSDWATLVDDVSVIETPEPTTVIMLGTGILLMGLRRNRSARFF
jgi:hypothetical protein